MPLWGNSTSDEKRPTWLRAGDGPANNINECFADERGWVIKHADGNEEVIVAIGGLSGYGTTDQGLGAATIVRVFFSKTGFGTDSIGTVFVQYNEKVNVKNLAATLEVEGSIDGTLVAYATTTTANKRVGFAFTTPGAEQTLVIPGQTIVGIITDTSTSVASDKIFISTEVTAAGGGTGVTTTAGVSTTL
jgi:hypothetical protein